MITDRVSNNPTVTFGLQRHRYDFAAESADSVAEPRGRSRDEGEVVGPMATRNVSDGMYMIGGERFPMVIVEFNKFNAHLPPWSQVVEMYLTDGEEEVFTFITAHLDTLVSGRLKSVQLALSAAFEGRSEGDIIQSTDVRESPPEPSESTSDFKVDGVLE